MSLQIQWTRIALQSLSEVSDYKKELQGDLQFFFNFQLIN